MKPVGADLPETNPQFDPTNPPRVERGGNRVRNREGRGNRERGGENRRPREN